MAASTCRRAEEPRPMRLTDGPCQRPIVEVGRDLDIAEEFLEPYGRDKAEVRLEAITASGRKPGKLILVSAVTPTPAGESKTTTSIGLAQGLHRSRLRRRAGGRREFPRGPHRRDHAHARSSRAARGRAHRCRCRAEQHRAVLRVRRSRVTVSPSPGRSGSGANRCRSIRADSDFGG